MGLFARGDIVLVRFPFSDLRGAKLRPALVVAQVDYDDLLLAQITSKNRGDRHAVELAPDDFESGNLRMLSYVRPGRMVTVEPALATRKLGTITEAKRLEVNQAIADAIA